MQPIVKYTNGLYVYIGADVELRGRIIGRDGRNLRALEAMTGTTIELHDYWAWVGGDTRMAELLAASYLFTVVKNPTTTINPTFVEIVIGIMKVRVSEMVAAKTMFQFALLMLPEKKENKDAKASDGRQPNAVRKVQGKADEGSPR
jgi:hypothetical protein